MVGPARCRIFEKGPHRNSSAVVLTRLCPAPKTHERAIRSIDRILLWKRDLEDRCQGAIMLRGGGTAFVVTAGGRIGADHQQILAGGGPLVARPSGQDHNIAGLEAKLFSAFTAEANPGMTARDAEYFVRSRVVVCVIVNAAAPRISPAVAAKQLFKYRRRIKVGRERDRASVEDERQFRIVRNDAVAFEAESVRLAGLNRVTKI